MHAAIPRRLAALALMVAALLMVGGTAYAAAPFSQSAGGTAACELPEPTDDDTISIIGRICDRRETPQVPVADVDGHRRGRLRQRGRRGDLRARTARSSIDLPGTAIEHLGKTYTVTIDEETLPEDTEPEVLERTATINIDSDQSVTFPIGAAGPGGTGFAAEALQLTVGGIVFSVLLAMAALGLSMIFGTTGLTNFAHGELITFGALVAYAVDKLPGSIEIGGTDVTVILAVIAAFIVSGAFGWLNDKSTLGAASPARHRADRDDDRQHRPVDLPAQHLPVLRRSAEPPVLAVLGRDAVGDRTGPADAQGARGHAARARRSCSPRRPSCSTPGSGRPPARSPTTRRCRRRPASTSSG